MPARTLQEGLVWDAKGRASESVPEGRVLVVAMEGFLDVGVNMVQSLGKEPGVYSDSCEA